MAYVVPHKHTSADLPPTPVAAHVPDAATTDAAAVAASVNALRDALIAAGLMAAS